MLTLPASCSTAILTFASLFSKRAWQHAQTLLVGALLAPAQRTVAAALRVMGLAEDRHFANYHRVLNRDRWSPRQAAQQLLVQLIDRFVPSGRVLVALDDTLERRRGAKIKAKGIYYDAVRSSRSQFVKSSGLRWLCLMLIAEMPFAQRRWALPVLTLLSPSERYHAAQGRPHKKLTDVARGALLQLARWLPSRQIVCVADSSFAVIDLLASVREHVTMITRLRLDAALYEPKPAGSNRGRPRLKGKRLPALTAMLTDKRRRWKKVTLARWYQQSNRTVEVLTGTAVWYHVGKAVVPIRWVLVRDPEETFKAQAFLSTDLAMSVEEILECFVERWQVEVTFEETRQHLGIETQRQWSDPAIERTTPALMALYSLVALMASELHQTQSLSKRCAAWYVKERITFSDALAAVRSEIWQTMSFQMSPSDDDMQKVPRELYERLMSTLCYGS
jgi:hypothetical protein